MDYRREVYRHYRECRFRFWLMIIGGLLGGSVIAGEGGFFLGTLAGLFVGMKLDERFSRKAEDAP